MNDILEKLADLHHQATEEKSHYYVGACIREAMSEIMKLREKIVEEISMSVDKIPKYENARKGEECKCPHCDNSFHIKGNYCGLCGRKG